MECVVCVCVDIDNIKKKLENNLRKKLYISNPNKNNCYFKFDCWIVYKFYRIIHV
jgi:hypothetical protein